MVAMGALGGTMRLMAQHSRRSGLQVAVTAVLAMRWQYPVVGDDAQARAVEGQAMM